MNKKFSTLVAACLAAGALVLPADLFAQIQYGGNKAYETVSALSKAPTNNTNCYLVFQEDGIDYVAVVKGNELVAKPFINATVDDYVIYNSSAKTLSNKNGETLSVVGTTYDKWGTGLTQMKFIVSSDKVGIEFGANCFVQKDGLTFSPVFNQGSKDFAAKLVSKSTTNIAEIPNLNPVATSQEIDSRYIVLMSAGMVIADDEVGKGNAELINSVDQEAYWTVKVVKTGSADEEAVATFVNKKTGKTLTFEGANVVAKVTYNSATKKYSFVDPVNALVLYKQTDMTTPVSFDYAGGTLSTFAVGTTSDYANTLSAQELMSINGASFGVKIVTSDNKTLANDPFSGNLKTVNWVNGNYTTEKVAEDKSGNPLVMLQNAEGELIVVDTKDPYASASVSNSYKVTTLTPSELAHALADNDATVSGRYNYQFSFVASETFVPGKDQNITKVFVYDHSYSYFAELGSINREGTPTLVATPDGTPNNPIKITIGTFNTIDVAKLLGTAPKFFTVTGKNTKKYDRTYNKVLGISKDGYIGYVETKEAQLNHPETQFAITVDGNDLVFTNRENPGLYPYRYNIADMYYVGNSTNVFAINGDTIEIKSVETDAADGYLRLNADELRDQVYYVGSYSAIYEAPAYFVENHEGSHQIGMDVNKENATEWNVVPLMTRDYDALNHTLKVYPDTIEVESVLGYYKDGSYTTTAVQNNNPKLKITAYTLQNSGNSEYIGYNNNRYTLGYDESGKYGYTSPNRYFAIRVVGDKQYNLVEVKDLDLNSYKVVSYNSTDEAYYAHDRIGLNYDVKVYSGDGANKGILNQIDLYSQTENDIIVIEPRDAAMYKKLAMADTISIYRNDDAQDVLFEKGEFLGTATSTQFADANPALYVDTAYVNRGNNNRWEYLLAVDAKHWESKVECDIPGHPKHEADTTTGRFLVNLMDSAYVYADNFHNNKFINEEDGEYFAKLGFVEGYHTHDTLYLKRPNGTYNKIAMDRAKASHSIAKFAFRYIDNNEDAFVIETGCKDYRNESSEVKTGYLKWLNGTIVVVDNINKADIFNMNEDETRTPTANETIAAGSVVVAGTNGAVVVKGAEGKNVIVSTILGKVVANEIVSSDNATIAAPQGVVVVSVDGESFKVVVK